MASDDVWDGGAAMDAVHDDDLDNPDDYSDCCSELGSDYEFDDDDVLEIDMSDVDPSALAKLIDDAAHRLANITAPDWYINPDFRALFEKRFSYDSIAASSPLTFAPGLEEVLTSSEAPDPAFFKSLPSPESIEGIEDDEGELWAVYAIVMERDDKCRLYVGSGTDSKSGVAIRLTHYRRGHPLLPRLVREAFEEGFDVVSKGLLCWTPLPSVGLRPRVRGRFLLLEALFTMVFLAALASTDSFINHMLP
jgi:hypothetical protein